MNVHRWPILIISLLLATSLPGCAILPNFFGKKVKPIEVVAKPIEKTPLDIPAPDPLKLSPVKWIIITPANMESIFKQMEQNEQNLVLFAITDDGYQSLAMTMAEIRNLINTQKTIIIKYKEYYEPVKPKETGTPVKK